ncbi:hypothetical protein MBM_01003 [Drepanopeziza brunnea f. sp. 'multigermtubi' MB_m1]|uniref:Uncharacterized protein n=1 Tax=Marssonina brunnea f. sp. multigermtubi (strain MB_m1) TaxID=1072389 RepID=K1X589_MARBU|nr:uncharacterized protein MBM_01003 [Drepanopeziza brunnea f. sp. 'multigermtubi' MB_m1]EKD20321.1 hypothetical protein MBM_01003 [Drepanopeziza brunnea f. sp. 'multigermtubi' MB_m1]
MCYQTKVSYICRHSLRAPLVLCYRCYPHTISKTLVNHPTLCPSCSNLSSGILSNAYVSQLFYHPQVIYTPQTLPHFSYVPAVSYYPAQHPQQTRYAAAPQPTPGPGSNGAPLPVSAAATSEDRMELVGAGVSGTAFPASPASSASSAAAGSGQGVESSARDGHWCVTAGLGAGGSDIEIDNSNTGPAPARNDGDGGGRSSSASGAVSGSNNGWGSASATGSVTASLEPTGTGSVAATVGNNNVAAENAGAGSLVSMASSTLNALTEANTTANTGRAARRSSV